jgi:hypothetical protein
MSVEPSLIRQDPYLKVRFGPFETMAEARKIAFELKSLKVANYCGKEKIR